MAEPKRIQIDPKSSVVSLSTLIAVIGATAVGAFYVSDIQHSVEGVQVSVQEVKTAVERNHSLILGDQLNLVRLQSTVEANEKASKARAVALEKGLEAMNGRLLSLEKRK